MPPQDMRELVLSIHLRRERLGMRAGAHEGHRLSSAARAVADSVARIDFLRAWPALAIVNPSS